MEPKTLKPTCDLCGSNKVVLDGHNQQGAQLYLCVSPTHGRHRFKVKAINSKTILDNTVLDHVGAILERAKNMNNTSIQKNDVEQTSTDTLTDYAWTQKKKGKKENTIKNRIYSLEWLKNKGANLDNPSSVETILCTEPMTNAQKYSAINAYKSYCKFAKIFWDDPPTSNYQPKEPFCPTTEEINALIYGAGKRTSTFLQVLATTGMRSGEATRLKWSDIDTEKLTISVNDPEKGSSTRTIHVPEKTIGMLSNFPRKYGDYIFNKDSNVARSNLVCLRKKLAAIQRNERFNRIHLHSFRHYFARKKLIETHDKPYIQYLLGHKSSKSTDRYTSFKDYPFDGKFKSAIALTTEEARRLVEEGWQFVCEVDKHPLFRRSV